MSPMRTMVAKLHTERGEDARNPAYIFTEFRIGYWMPEGEVENEMDELIPAQVLPLCSTLTE